MIPIPTSSLVELRRGDGPGIVAIVYRDGRRRGACRLPDGAIVEVPGPDRRPEAPAAPEAVVGLTIDGRAASAHDACLGLIAAHAPLTGVFLLPGGGVAAVYGAVASPIG